MKSRTFYLLLFFLLARTKATSQLDTLFKLGSDSAGCRTFYDLGIGHASFSLWDDSVYLYERPFDHYYSIGSWKLFGDTIELKCEPKMYFDMMRMSKGELLGKDIYRYYSMRCLLHGDFILSVSLGAGMSEERWPKITETNIRERYLSVKPMFNCKKSFCRPDLYMSTRSELYAVDDGFVLFYLEESNELFIKHYGYVSKYTNVETITCKEGDFIKRGVAIGNCKHSFPFKSYRTCFQMRCYDNTDEDSINWKIIFSDHDAFYIDGKLWNVEWINGY